jgi:hypothetical protein
MTYTAGIPLPTDIPANSQQQIANNFTVINTYLPTEHTGMNSGADLGKHRFITLKRNPAAPASVGNDIHLQQTENAGKWSVDAIDSAGVTKQVEMRTMLKPPVTANIPAGSGTRNVVDLATVGLGANCSGTIFLYDNLDFTRSIFTTFLMAGGQLYIPGGPGQMASGTVFTGFTHAGTMLRITVSSYPAGGTTVTVIISESRTI